MYNNQQTMKKPKYSIIMPTKNRGYCIWKSILSVQRQLFPDWELIIVDGNSSDNTIKVVEEFNDQRIKIVINTDDTGVSSARNFGIKQSHATYIAYLDSDDTLFDNWLLEMNSHIEAHNEKVLFIPNKNYVLQEKIGFRKYKIYKEKILFNNELTINDIIALKVECDTNGLIHRKDILNNEILWNEDLDHYEDYDFLLSIIEKYPDGISFVSQVLLTYKRTYGKDSLCSKAVYRDLISALTIIHTNHNTKLQWYPSLINKYKNLDKDEVTHGRTIIENIRERYS